MRVPVLALFASALAIGCASATNRRSASPAEWPLGNDAQQRARNSLEFGAPGRLRFSSPAPVYLLFLELRPTRDSLDIRLPVGEESLEALTGPVDLVAPMETVDRSTRATVSEPAANCTIMRNAGDELGAGHEFCPVSRSYGQTPSRTWDFRNRVFVLVSNVPFPNPLPSAIPWAAQRTVPPVSPGSGWTVLGL